ncbi:unnamed protein product [Cylindrotheca closterium]|uniref:WWE domain-containing protein n=1 Tax=Cylindrotheca closterium TaxID=2856 RepID=A0AAD2D077_9STRA|nr:unnamed protein product [Cylindrotheca closterium]
MPQHDPSKIMGDPKDCWIRYDSEPNQTLEQAYRSQNGTGRCTPMTHYTIDFELMLQRKITTGYTRRVCRFDVDNNAEDSKTTSSALTTMVQEQRMLRPETSRFLHALHKYLDCRTRMYDKYLEVDEFQTIYKYPILDDSGGIVKCENPTEYKANYQQQSIEGRTVQGLDELYQAAEIAEPIFRKAIENKVQQVLDECGNQNGSNKYIVFAPLKKKLRAEEKARNDYCDRVPGPPASWLCDIVRGSIEFTCAKQVLKCLELIKHDDSLHIVKVKNRFQSPSLTGYRDIIIHIQIDTKLGFKHICEIQIHHKLIRELDKTLNSHGHYEYFRSYFAGATASLQERLTDLELINGGEQQLLDLSTLDQLLKECIDEKRLARLEMLFRDQLCEYDWALRVSRKLLDLRLNTYGNCHSLVSSSLKSIAGLQLLQDRPEDALRFYKRNLEIDKKLFGQNHLSVADTYNDMAIALHRQGKVESGKSFFERSLEIKKNLLWGEHSAIAELYSNLSVSLQQQGRLKESMELCRKSLQIYEKNQGKDSSSTAIVYNNMSIIVEAMGNQDKAFQLGSRAANAFKRHLGEDHSFLACTYYNIASILMKQGDLSDAMEYCLRSLKISERNLSSEHCFVTMTVRRMAIILEQQGEIERATKLYETARLQQRDSLRKRFTTTNLYINEVTPIDTAPCPIYFSSQSKLAKPWRSLKGRMMSSNGKSQA